MNVGNDGNMPPPIVILSAYSLSEKQQGPNAALKADKMMSTVVNILRRFNLDKIPPNWTSEIWSSQFTDNSPISDYEKPIEDEDSFEDDAYSKFLEETDIGKLYNQATEATIKWLELSKKEAALLPSADEAEARCLNSTNQSLSQVDTVFWNTLIQEKVEFRSLIALLFHHIDLGQRVSGGGSGYIGADRDLGLKATGLYFILLAIPGSSAFNIFHPMLYSKALSSFKLANKLHEVRQPSKKRKHGSKSTQGSQAGSVRGASVISSPIGKPRKRHTSRAGSISSRTSSQTDFWDDSGDEEDDTLTPLEISALTSGLNKVLYNLLITLDNFSMKRLEEPLELTVQSLVDLTHIETTYANLDFGVNRRRSDLSALAYNAYIGLEKICGNIHGAVDKVQGPLLFRCVLPGLLMTVGSSDISPKGYGVIREHALHFIKHLMAHIGNPCNNAVEILIHHLAFKVPDKAEFRQKASSAIVELTLGLPQEYFSRIVRWFFQLAHNDKTAHRQFAIEVMGRLLAENERKNLALPKTSGLALEDQHLDSEENENQRPNNDNFKEAVEVDIMDFHEEKVNVVEQITQKEGTQETSEEIQKDQTDTVYEKDNLFSHKFLFGVIFSRCRDVSATVRAKALHTLANITAANNATVAVVIGNLFSDLQSEDAATPNTLRTNHEHVDFVEILQDPEANLSEINPLPSTHAFIDFLRRRALDDSVYVRKNALQVLENILKFSGIPENIENVNSESVGKKYDLLNSRYGHELIGILAEHCRDPSLMVRKQMVGSLTELLKTYPENDVVIDNWVEGIFPLILDVEQKIAEKVQESIWQCLFGNLVSHKETKDPHNILPWRIMAATEHHKMTKYLGRACSLWASSGQLQPSVLELLKSHVEENSHYSNYGWLLLAQVSGHVPLKDPQFVMEYFNNSIHTPEGVGLYTLLQVLRVLFASVSYLTMEQRRSLHKDLIMLVKKFSIPPELISTSVDICTVISSLDAVSGNKKTGLNTPNKEPKHQPKILFHKPKTGEETNVKLYHKLIDGWAVEIIELIDKELSQKILRESSNEAGKSAETTRTMRQIFTLGELAQICPQRINKKMFLLMQSIIFQQSSSKPKKSKSRKGNHNEDPKSGKESNVNFDAEPTKTSFKPTAKMQALSVLTLAKMCLQNEEMAKKIIPAFGRLLGTTSDTAIKNNIMYALTDMCVRYASLVDPLLPQMTACLKEKSLVVRRTTLTTIINLLQEDYLKLTGNLFFRILQTLSDESEEILNLTTFYIQQRLLKRKPKVMYSHFIEAIFHFNEYKDHQSYNKFVVSDYERELFSLVGARNKSARMKLYRFMLENMSDDQRFQTTFKLCKDILQGAVEGSVKLTGKESFELLQDTLACLASDEIKLASLKTRHDDIGEMDGAPDVEGAVASAVKKAIISQHVKTNVIENIVPIVIALKRKLEEMKSPLIDDLMSYLREIMKDYKSEVKEILSADKQLAAEIQFDLKKWEEEQAEQMANIKRQQEEMAETRPPSPQLDQNKMLRNVLLKAVQNLRRSQHREGKESAQRQEEQELQLPQPRPDMNEGELQYDIAIERINRIESTTNKLSKKDQTDPPSQGKDSLEKAALDETTNKSDSCINPSSPVEQSLQSFIATNLSNNTRRISSKNPSLTRRRSSVRSTNQDLSDKTERGAIVQSLEDELQLDIDSDVDECQIALSPKVVLSRLKCSPKDTGKTTSDKDVSRKRIRKRLETSSDDGSKEEEPDSEDGTISEKEIPLDDDDQLKDKRGENEFVAQKDNQDEPQAKNPDTVHTSPSDLEAIEEIDSETTMLQDDKSESNVSVKSTTSGKTSRKRRLEVAKDTITEEDTFLEPLIAPIGPATKENTAAETRPKFRLKGSNVMKRQRTSMLRAISTPTKDDTLMRENVTFNISGVANCTDDLSLANISAIPILSPPSPDRESRRISKKKSLEQEKEIGIESFRFCHGKKDEFEEMVRRGSKDHAKDIDINKKSIKSRKQKGTKSGQVQMHEPTSDCNITDTEEELKDDSPKRRIIKRKDKKAVEHEKLILDEDESISEKNTTKIDLPSDEQLAEIECMQKEDSIIRKPATKSPFKAIRGEGNSFHGWFS